MGELQCSNAGGSERDQSASYREDLYNNETTIMLGGEWGMIGLATVALVTAALAVITVISLLFTGAFAGIAISGTDWILYQYTTLGSLETLMASYYTSVTS